MKHHGPGLVLLLICGLLVSSTTAAQSTSWKLVKAESVQELVGSDHDLRYVTLSPDGIQLAWGEDNQLCLYMIESAETSCYPVPNDFHFGGNYVNLSWSPNSQYLVFTESFFDFFKDSDIWLFDTTSNTFEDRTDDNYLGSVITPKDNVTPLLDYLPTWNPANGDLYFFRSIRDKDNTTLTLQLLPPERKEAKQVFDLSVDLPVLSVFRPAAISPDGKQMALIVLATNPREDSRSGLWLLNLKDGALKQVMTLDQLSLGLPEWDAQKADGIFPDGVGWNGEDTLVVTAQNYLYATGSITSMAYAIDLKSGTVSPLTDFTAVADEKVFRENTEDFGNPVYRMPRAGVVMPDGSGFLYFGESVLVKQAVISLLPLPPGDLTPVQLGTLTHIEITHASIPPPAISDDGTRALLFGYLVTLEKG